MKVIDFAKSNSVINQFLAELRDVDYQKNALLFRNNVVRIGHAMAYEISRSLTYEKKMIQTPLDSIKVSLPTDKIVLATVFRAGLPLHQGFLEVFDKAENGFVSAYRYYKDKEGTDVGIKIEYIASPSLDDKTLIIVDPMLATGGSMELAYEAFLTKGKPKRLIMACVIASKQGVDFLRKAFPSNDVELYCGAIDPTLNEHKYIVPGLGDAGDLEYGEKL
ncbi:MAG: uracil phosphoribosyltransferase [Prevotellaceae bacterium]|nr:uracil phosphoribosyltransferase [Candidatus Minthosoma caballi]